MNAIKPSEISDILKNNLENITTVGQIEEVGTVLQIGDGIARVYGLDKVQYGELVEFENGAKGIALNLEEDNVGIVALGNKAGVRVCSDRK